MAEQKNPTAGKKPSRRNVFFLEGYLKENALTLSNNIVRGFIVIAVNEHNTFKVQYYVPKTNKDGTENKDYADLVSLLPSNGTISIAQYLQQTPTANFANAQAVATKVWAGGRLEEFVVLRDGKEKSMVTYKGSRGGIKDNGRPFDARATFKCDMYLEAKRPEVKNEQETGRLLLTGVIPNYRGLAYRFNFVTAEGLPSEVIGDLYEVGQTVYVAGNIDAVQVESSRTAKNSSGWGSESGTFSKTYFTTQFTVTGGNKTPLDEDAEGAFTKDEIMQALVTRQEEAVANSEKRNATKPFTGEENKKNVTSKATVMDTFTDNFDFTDF